MKVLGLTGYPLSHSFSKKYFGDKFEKENISGFKYELFPIEDISLLPQLLRDNPEITGLNVTIPYKEKVIQFLDFIDGTAKKIGAVNCIKISEKNSKKWLMGFNTDVYGFELSLKPLLTENHKKALILGTGGASKAVEFVLQKLNITYQYVSRTARNNILSYENLDEKLITEHKLIINTSPLGMYPNVNDAPSLPYEAITPEHLLFDLIYNPEITKFMQLGNSKGAIVKNGLEMLYGQAEMSWEIWNTQH